MPMKISLVLGTRRQLDRQTAWGCLTSNATVPGLGSLIAGRVTGYAQLVIGLIGLILSCHFGIRFIHWYFTHRTQLEGLMDDTSAYFLEIWLHLRWAVLGLGVFGFAWLWSLATSLVILFEAKKNAQPPVASK